MERILLILGLMTITAIAQASWLMGIDKGRRAEPYNTTVSSTSAAVLTEANAQTITDWSIVNNGSYAVYYSTFSVISTNTLCFKINAGGSLSPEGKTISPVYLCTDNATAYTSRVDIILYKE